MGKSRNNGLTVALLFVLMLLLLLVVGRYSFKHDLPAARFVRGLFAGGASETASTPADTPVPGAKPSGADASASALEAASDYTSYGAFLAKKLLPEYGLMDPGVVAAAVANGYAFADGADSAGATGLCCAESTDLDNDGADELIVLRIRQDGDAFPLTLQIYRLENGFVTDAPVATADIINLTGVKSNRSDRVEIVQNGANRYLLYHLYAEDEVTFFDRYVAYDITGGTATRMLDGVFTYYDGALLLLATVPPWIDADALADAPTATDPVSGLTGKVLYADAITDAPYAGGTATFAAYAGVYEDADAALSDMLAPVTTADGMLLLEPLSTDWSNLNALIAGAAAAS